MPKPDSVRVLEAIYALDDLLTETNTPWTTVPHVLAIRHGTSDEVIAEIEAALARLDEQP